MRKTCISVILVALFLAMMTSTAISAPNIEIITPKDNEHLNKVLLKAEQADIDELVVHIEAFKTWIETARPFEDFNLSDEEKEEIKSKANNIIDSLNVILVKNNQDPISPTAFFKEMFGTDLLGRSTIVSVGRGIAFIPLYGYETFLGIMLRPMLLFYPPIIGGGYTGNFNANLVPPRIQYGDRLGTHLLITTAFAGIYINIGKLGINLPGPCGLMILLGRAHVVM